MDPQAVRLRFFCHIRHFTHAMAARMTQVDYDRELSLAAFADRAGHDMVGMATLIGDANADTGEFALQVRADFGRCGLGTHLLQRLIEQGRRQGLRLLYGDVLNENVPMLRLADRLGFERRAHPDEPECLRVELRLG
jgi:acetyltransferase